MTQEEIDTIIQDSKSQDSDFENPRYKVYWFGCKGKPVENLPLFVARMLVREFKKRDIIASIRVE